MSRFLSVQRYWIHKFAFARFFSLRWAIIAIIAVLGLLFGVLPGVQAADGQHDGEYHAIIYVFWGNGCPHCEAARPVIAELAKKYEGVDLFEYEVWYDEANQLKFDEFANKYGFSASGVPTIFLGTKYWTGWTEGTTDVEIEKQIEYCLSHECPDSATATAADITAAIEAQNSVDTADTHQVKLPFTDIAINLDQQSLLVSTLVIAFVDGFNPCSLWVLSMLMALTLHTGSRRKIAIIGLVFLTVTASVYALFIAGLFTFLSVINFIPWIRVVVALISLTFAVINIKDYFWYKEGVSLTISDDAKPGIFQKMRKVINASDSFPAMVAATVGLSAGVSLVEFSCTAGFPVLWTNLLTSQGVVGVTSLTFIGLLLVYLLIYQLDELVIFGTVVYTLRASRVEEKHGRILKLIGGTLMLTLAAVMLINPALMNDFVSSLLIFGAAFLLTVVILIVHRKLLPAMGIWIGSEARPGKGHKPRRRSSR